MENIVALVLATVVLVAIPGPNVAIIVAKSIQQGFRAGITATLGTTTGVAAQLLLTIFGVAAIVESAASALATILAKKPCQARKIGEIIATFIINGEEYMWDGTQVVLKLNENLFAWQDHRFVSNSVEGLLRGLE